MARKRITGAELIALATRNARAPSPDRWPNKCEWPPCKHTVDRSKPRAKHQRFCSARCRKAAYDARIAALVEQADRMS